MLSPTATWAAIIASKLRNYSAYLLEWHDTESQWSSHFSANSVSIFTLETCPCDSPRILLITTLLCLTTLLNRLRNTLTYCDLGPDSIWRCHLTSIGNPIVEIRRSYDRLISTTVFPIPVRCNLYIASGPWCVLMAQCLSSSRTSTRSWWRRLIGVYQEYPNVMIFNYITMNVPPYIIGVIS